MITIVAVVAGLIIYDLFIRKESTIKKAFKSIGGGGVSDPTDDK